MTHAHLDATGCPASLRMRSLLLSFLLRLTRHLFGPRRALFMGSAAITKVTFMKTFRTSLLSLLLLLGTSWADDRKLSPELKGLHSADSMDVIVQFKVTPAQKHRDRIAAHGGLVKQHLHTVKGLLVNVPAWRVKQLSDDPDIAYVSPDRPVTRQMNNSAVAVLANYAWNLGLDGTGIGVAVIDSGVHGVDDL